MAGVLTATPTGPRLRLGRRAHAWLLLAPAGLFLFVLFVIPIGYVLWLSITEPTLTLEHYARIFTVPLYVDVLVNTFVTSIFVTIACLLLAYPMAYVMATRNDWASTLMFATVAVSFWTGFLVRTYAWLVILGNQGPVIGAFKLLGVEEPPQILFTSFSAALGIVHILLPFMVLALYSVMSKIDGNHVRAATSLGARPFEAFWHVYLPLSLPGVVNGAVLVFTICLGFYITPILLGTPQDMMISQLINQQIEELLAWGFAAALSVVLLVATGIFMLVYNRFAGLDRLYG